MACTVQVIFYKEEKAMSIVFINYELSAGKELTAELRELLITSPKKIVDANAHPIAGQGAQVVYFAACKDSERAAHFAEGLYKLDGQDSISVLHDEDALHGYFIMHDGKPSHTWSGYTWARSEFKTPV